MSRDDHFIFEELLWILKLNYNVVNLLLNRQTLDFSSADAVSEAGVNWSSLTASCQRAFLFCLCRISSFPLIQSTVTLCRKEIWWCLSWEELAHRPQTSQRCYKIPRCHPCGRRYCRKSEHSWCFITSSWVTDTDYNVDQRFTIFQAARLCFLPF